LAETVEDGLFLWLFLVKQDMGVKLLCEEGTVPSPFISCFTVHYYKVSNGGRTYNLLSEAVFSNTSMFYERLLHCQCLLYVG